MTNTNDRDREALEARLDALPMMSVDLPGALILMGDAFDIDPIDLLDILIADDSDSLAEMREMSGAKEINLMIDMIYEGVDSSTYLPAILDAISTMNALLEFED